MQKILFFLLGAFTSALFVIGGGYMAYRFNLLESVIRSVAYQKEDWPSSGLPETASPDNPTELVVAVVVVPVPKEFASEEYQAAIADVFTTLNELSVSNEKLTSTLIEMNDRSVAGNFEGFFDVVFRAKTELVTQRSVAAKMNEALIMLDARRVDVEYMPLEGATVSVVSSGRKMLEALTNYAASVDIMLSGSVPKAEDIAALYSTAGNLRVSSELFATELEMLGSVLMEYVPAEGSATSN